MVLQALTSISIVLLAWLLGTIWPRFAEVGGGAWGMVVRGLQLAGWVRIVE